MNDDVELTIIFQQTKARSFRKKERRKKDSRTHGLQKKISDTNKKLKMDMETWRHAMGVSKTTFLTSWKWEEVMSGERACACGTSVQKCDWAGWGEEKSQQICRPTPNETRNKQVDNPNIHSCERLGCVEVGCVDARLGSQRGNKSRQDLMNRHSRADTGAIKWRGICQEREDKMEKSNRSQHH